MVARVRKNTTVVEEPLEEIVPLEPKVELLEEEKPKLTVYPKQEEPVVEDTPKSEVIRWKKIGNGSFIHNNRYIKPGQIFTATVEEIPTAFRDLIIPLEKLPEDKLLSAKKSSNYTLVEIEGTNTWNIVDSQGKIFNEKPMARLEAEKLLNVI